MHTIAVEGLDGSGKTTVAAELAQYYAGQGLKAQVVSPYRQANAELGHDIYPLWKSTEGGMYAIAAIQKVLKRATQQAQETGTDMLIFDRHWMTAFTEIAANQELVDLWGDSFVPTAYLSVDPAVAQQRVQNDHQAAWMDRHNLANYATRYQTLCRNYGAHLLGIYRNDDDVLPDSIARSIAWDANILR